MLSKFSITTSVHRRPCGGTRCSSDRPLRTLLCRRDFSMRNYTRSPDGRNRVATTNINGVKVRPSTSGSERAERFVSLGVKRGSARL